MARRVSQLDQCWGANRLVERYGEPEQGLVEPPLGRRRLDDGRRAEEHLRELEGRGEGRSEMSLTASLLWIGIPMSLCTQLLPQGHNCRFRLRQSF